MGSSHDVSVRTGQDGARTADDQRFYDLSCVIHVHSTFSDGTATVEEIIAAASGAGVDAVLLTDHDTRAAARHGYEGWHDRVLLLVGHEITTRDGHLLAFGVDEEISHHGLSEAQICGELEARGGFGFAAHPFSTGGFHPAIVRPHPWRALAECRTCGIELWSFVTEQAESWRSPLSALRFMLDPEAALDGPLPDHLARWDRLCALRRVPAIGGLDAHQPGIRIAGRVRSPMPNARYFRTLRTHVLLDGPPRHALDHDRTAVYTALRQGRCYLAADAIAPGRRFAFHAEDEHGATAPMGSETDLRNWMLHLRTPRPARLRLLRDGQPLAETHADALQQPIERAGVYRAEAWLDWRGRKRLWIVSNPIYIRERRRPQASQMAASSVALRRPQ